MSQSQQTPVLPSTADATPYVPISWMAVSAALVTAFYVILLIVLGIKSIGGKSPLLIWQLFLMPIIGVVLSFAARRTIRNAEGTRTGENLANLAWWGAVVGGLGYGAYYLAIEFAIRRDAADEVNRWVKNIIQDDPANPAHPGLSLAFNETLEPDRRRAGSDASQLEAEFREQFIAFTQCDLVRLVQRNPGECRYEDGGVKEWVNRQYGIDCQYSGAVKCREGVFPLLIPVKGIESGIVSQTPGRKWLVSIPPNGLFVPEGSTRTPYGWLVELLEQSGTQFGKDFFAVIGTGGPSANSMIIHDALGKNTVAYQIAYHFTCGPTDRQNHWFTVARQHGGPYRGGGRAGRPRPVLHERIDGLFPRLLLQTPERRRAVPGAEGPVQQGVGNHRSAPSGHAHEKQSGPRPGPELQRQRRPASPSLRTPVSRTGAGDCPLPAGLRVDRPRPSR